MRNVSRPDGVVMIPALVSVVLLGIDSARDPTASPFYADHQRVEIVVGIALILAGFWHWRRAPRISIWTRRAGLSALAASTFVLAGS